MVLNRVQIIGYLGKDADIKEFENINSTITMSVGTTQNEFITKNGRKVPEKTEWHRIVFWCKSADQEDYLKTHLKKGRQVYVEGSLKTRKYTDKSNIERSITEIEADKVELI